MYETKGFGINKLKEELAKTEYTPRCNYYFSDPGAAPDFEDLPKYLNDDDEGIQMYAREMLKKGSGK